MTQNKRYLVRHNQLPDNRHLVWVFDIFIGRIIYTANTKNKIKEYEYIKNYYGIDNCDPPLLDVVYNIRDYQ